MEELEFLKIDKYAIGSAFSVLEALINSDGKEKYKSVRILTNDGTEVSPFDRINDVVFNTEEDCIQLSLSIEEYLMIFYSELKGSKWITPFLLKFERYNHKPTYIIIKLNTEGLKDTIKKIVKRANENKTDK